MNPPFAPTDTVLEVGGGDVPRYRPNMDVRALPNVDHVVDLGGRWPVVPDHFDGVYSSYCIEHVSWRKIPQFISEVFRVLRPGGRAYIITANTEAQMRWALSQPEIGSAVGQCLFGDNDYPENTHRAALSPTYAIRLFREAGFTDVVVLPWGALGTDMVIEAVKRWDFIPYRSKPPDEWTTEDRERAYGHEYFNGGGSCGGYAREGYQDFPVHDATFKHVMALKPESVLELGCARGYMLQRLQGAGVRVFGFEVSEHCLQTRAVDTVYQWDITRVPWPIDNQTYDLCLSMAVLEHIPERCIDAVIAEIKRTCRRGLHGIDFGDHDDGFDKTHCLFRPPAWWVARFADAAQVVVDKEALERP